MLLQNNASAGSSAAMLCESEIGKGGTVAAEKKDVSKYVANQFAEVINIASTTGVCFFAFAVDAATDDGVAQGKESRPDECATVQNEAKMHSFLGVPTASVDLNMPLSVPDTAVNDTTFDKDEAAYPLSKETLDELPGILHKLIKRYGYGEPYAQTMMALGQMATLSAVMPNVSFFREKTYYLNMGLVVYGKAASGKGAIQNCKALVQKIDDMIYSEHLAAEENGGEHWSKMKTLILPANTTNAAFNKMLERNDGRGLIFESEMKTLISAMKRPDFGLSRESLLAAFEHEQISKARATKNELDKVKAPKVSVVVTGVPADVPELVGNDGNTNGLVSRLFYFELKPKKRVIHLWADEEDERPVEEFVSEEADLVYRMFMTLNGRDSQLHVKFDKEDKTLVDQWLVSKVNNLLYAAHLGDDFEAVMMRLPVNICRIASELTVLEYVDRGDFASLSVEENINVSKRMLGVAIKIGDMLFEQAIKVYARNCNTEDAKRIKNNLKQTQNLLNKLEVSKKKRLLTGLRLMNDDGCFTRSQFVAQAKATGYTNESSIYRMFRSMADNGKVVPVEGMGEMFTIADGVVS
ncbi:MAG: DUF3987 domain-containing protein [Prevotellaceae bacterium]|nr:DUF3987 domain-containing protein [Prevotellaceae bacterium]